MHERITAGVAAARSRGRVGGRPRALSRSRLAHARQLRDQGVPVWEIAQLLGVGRSTVVPESVCARCERRSALSIPTSFSYPGLL
jgi:DNA invertase Pin-like site-specific DNA recombinase